MSNPTWSWPGPSPALASWCAQGEIIAGYDQRSVSPCCCTLLRVEESLSRLRRPAPPITDHHTPTGGQSVCSLGIKDLMTLQLAFSFFKMYFRPPPAHVCLIEGPSPPPNSPCSPRIHFRMPDMSSCFLLVTFPKIWFRGCETTDFDNVPCPCRIRGIRIQRQLTSDAALPLFTPDCCGLIFLLCAFRGAAAPPPSVPDPVCWPVCWMWAGIPAHIVIFGFEGR